MSNFIDDTIFIHISISMQDCEKPVKENGNRASSSDLSKIILHKYYKPNISGSMPMYKKN